MSGDSSWLGDVFAVSVCADGAPAGITFLPELAESGAALSWDSLQEAVFERLMMPGLDDAWTYLTDCSCRLGRQAALSSDHQQAGRRVIVQNMSTVLQQPDIFGMAGRRVVLDSLRTHLGVHGWFDDTFQAVVQQLLDEGAPVREIFQELFKYIQGYVGETKGSLMTMDRFIYSLVAFMSTKPALAEILVSLSEVPVNLKGVLYCRVPLGSLLWPSALNMVGGNLEFFDSPVTLTQQSVDLINSNIWTSQKYIADATHRVFEGVLRCGGRARQLLLRWLASCLRANAGRSKLWNTDMDGQGSAETAPDGFTINLCAVLLRLAMPFCADLDSAKLLDLDPTYCAAPFPDTAEEQANRWQHLPGLAEETFLVSPEQSDNNGGDDGNELKPQFPDKFNFRTECFYLCHKALQIGIKVMQDRLSKLNGELGQMQRVYQDAMSQAADQDPASVETIKNRFEQAMQRYLTLRSALMEPSVVENTSRFLTSTAVWLTQQAVRDPAGGALRSRLPVTFPLSARSHPGLTCVPELLVDNMTSHLLTVGRFAPEQWAITPEVCQHAFTFIIVFMGSTRRMRNPHLRAHLAACLETMLPDFNAGSSNGILSTGFHREQLFVSHELADHVVASLLHVFVSIEMTGQSVQFEEKFNYRRPMYVIMKYLWSLPRHRNMFISLSKTAERDIESADPPVLLRFINLLMNDAVFLLDESLSYMTQLRDQVQHRQSEEYGRLTSQQRQQQEANFRHMGQLSRFHNIMGRETISVLEMLSSGIKSIFLQASIVDRVVSMLNYFLLQLVGPKRRELKVKATDDYDFRPGEVVTDICRIYVHLKCDAFCSAVGSDERSYSPQLFADAVQVLGRIGQGQLVPDVEEVAAHVASTGAALKAEGDLAAQAPDRFLDPIMSTLMSDPVTLPSSGIVCDRTTIARHLLSDQTDPFNRQPLTMDLVVTNTTLKLEIEEWRRLQLAGNKQLQPPSR